MAYVLRKPTKERRTPTSKKKDYAEIYNDPRWVSLRERKFIENPVCEECERKGVTTPTQEVHHIIKFSDGLDKREVQKLAYSKINLKSLCIPCHKDAHKKYFIDKRLRMRILGY